MIKLQIRLTALDGRHFWLDKYDNITGDYKKAVKTNDLEKIVNLVKRYNNLFKITVCTCEGEVIRTYERKKDW